MDNILEITNLNKSFKNFALKDVSFNLQKGFIMGFIGPNGAGKTTTIKLIMNLLQKESGQIKVFGLDHQKHELEIKNRIGFVYEDNFYYEELTLKEMKRVVAPFYSKWDDALYKNYMGRFGLDEKKQFKNLSKGTKMKFALTMALSHHAELLIMDEPTSGLDPVVRNEFLDILTDLIQDENKSVFFSTHITSDLDKIADYVTFINQGEIILSMPKDELLDTYGVLKGGKEILTPGSKDQFVGIRENQYGFEGLVSNRSEARKLFGDRVVIEKPTLEDILLHHIRRA